MNVSLKQGNTYLDLNRQKSNCSKYVGDSDISYVEGFTGSGRSTKANVKNTLEAEHIDKLRENYDKAVSQYSIAQKQLMDETATFINNTSSGSSTGSSFQNSFIEMTNGAIGYVTDKNTFKYISSTDILDSIQGKNGCPSSVTQVGFESDNYQNVGEQLGTTPDLTVGTPMTMNSSCAPSSVNIQILGASDPSENKADWLGCFDSTGDFFTKQDDLTGMSSSDILSNCQTRAADTGASTYFIGSETDNSYSCFTSKSGMTTVDIEKGMKPGYLLQTSKVIHETDQLSPTTSDVPAAGIMNNGQIAIGTVSGGISNFGSQAKNAQIKTDMDGIENCDAVYGSRITLSNATYGGNCNGITYNGKGPWTVPVNNWLDTTQGAIDSTGDGTTGDLLISFTTDPAEGCPKEYSASYTCSPNTQTKIVDIPGEASGKTAVFDCSSENATCREGVLTLGDDGNLTLTNGDNEIVYQSGTNQVGITLTEYSAANSKYGRNYLKTGEYLLDNQFIGSPSGNCALMCATVSNVTNLSIVYFAWGCNKPGTAPSTNAGEDGFITDVPGLRATYSMQDGVIDNSGVDQVVYSDTNMNKRRYPSDMISLGSDYIDVGNYDQATSSIKVISNSDLDDCKLECSAIDKCYGFIHNEQQQQCAIKSQTNMFPNNPNRILSENAKMFVRQYNIANSNSCSDEVVAASGNIYNGMVEGSDTMSPATLCGLGESTAVQVKELAEREKELEYAARNVSQYTSMLNKENNALDKKMLRSLKQNEQDVLNYTKITTDIKNTEKQLINVNAMEDDSNLEMISQNMKFMGWTALAAIAVIAGIKATR